MILLHFFFRFPVDHIESIAIDTVMITSHAKLQNKTSEAT